jgi:hypothetical protein
MKLDKKQVPQFVVLGLLVLACIGYASFTVFKPPAVELKPPAPKEPDKSGAGIAVVRLTAQPVQSTAAFPDLSTPIARRDPFTVQTLSSSDTTNPDKQANVKPVAKAEQVAKIASTKVPPLIPQMGAFAGNLSVQPSVQNEDPDFVLTGVIRGWENVAIIRVGGSERHVVKQGQFINGRYQVLFVTSDGAVLACGNRRIHLKLGGVRNAS